MKRCTMCKKEKSFSEFYKEKHRKDGYCYWCKVCRGAYFKKLYKKNPTPYLKAQEKYLKRHPKSRRNSILKHAFGITLKEYNILLKLQHSRCAICGLKRSAISRNLDVDHSHKTGKVRGLLCGKCNKGLGLFQDNKKILANAINYIEKSPC